MLSYDLGCISVGQESEGSGWNSEELEDFQCSEVSVASGNLQACEAGDILQVLEADCILQGCWRAGKWESCCRWSEPAGTEVRTSCTGWAGTSLDCGLGASCRD